MFSFKIRAGVPPSKEPLFTFFIEQTTDLAATTQFSGMYAPFNIRHPIPIQTCPPLEQYPLHN